MFSLGHLILSVKWNESVDWRLNWMWRALCWVSTTSSEFRIKSLLLVLCLGTCSHLRGPGQARQIWTAALHQTFWRHGLVPSQRSQGGRAYSWHVEERAVSLCVGWMHVRLIQVWVFVIDVQAGISVFVGTVTLATVPACKEFWPKPCVYMCVFCFQVPGCGEPSVSVPHGPPPQWVSPGSCQPAGHWHRPAEGENTQPWLEISADS